ncbi:hypothetical protein BY996DRAFT_6593311 [Phakopsora pachyrhizi]|nr:hypothetical protein BY996DRAFT_6593311 [Phakopsora pachyrhizi]
MSEDLQQFVQLKLRRGRISGEMRNSPPKAAFRWWDLSAIQLKSYLWGVSQLCVWGAIAMCTALAPQGYDFRGMSEVLPTGCSSLKVGIQQFC